MLSVQQMEQYDRDGYVLVSGLIPEETITKAESAMWSVLEMDADDSRTWSHFPEKGEGVATNTKLGLVEHFGLQHPDLLACCTPEFFEVQNQLAQEIPSGFSCQKPQPEALWTRSVFPVSGDWGYVGPHIDGGHRPFDIFPGSFRVSSLTYLDEGVAQGGGTVVWPGAHRKLSEAAKREPDLYSVLSDFKPPVEKFDLGDPVELRPARGDVLFFHYLTVHCGSLNTSTKPRFALRWMCECESCHIWQKHGKWNVWMP